MTCILFLVAQGKALEDKQPHIRIRGLYGGVPVELFEQGRTLKDFGINAVFIGSGQLTGERLARLKGQGAQVYAEFNTLHEAGYLKQHPDAAPVGTDGKACPPPNGWQGLCPTHEGYRRYRMDAFRAVLKNFAIDGIWLDYHHSHASWEQATPSLPDTCFCPRCREQFVRDAGISLPKGSAPEFSPQLLGPHHSRWVEWRCAVFTDWVREFRAILNETRPQALLGTFHCPWSDTDNAGALRNKLAIDLKAQAKYLDVFSPMTYHARFGYASDPAWISRQTAWLGRYLGLEGKANKRHKIWPIVQLSDWGESVPVTQVQAVMDHGTRPPATGVIVFAWGGLRRQMEKVEALGQYYRRISP